jgi:hypothetical protein
VYFTVAKVKTKQLDHTHHRALCEKSKLSKKQAHHMQHALAYPQKQLTQTYEKGQPKNV